MERKLTDFLKEPLSGGRLKLIPSLLIFIVSVFVNAYFQVTSFSTLVSWILETSKTADAAHLLEDILARSDTAIGVRIAFGLLMTVFAMAFLLIAAYWEEKEKNAVHLFERACATMLVPELLMFVAALLCGNNYVLWKKVKYKRVFADCVIICIFYDYGCNAYPKPSCDNAWFN